MKITFFPKPFFTNGQKYWIIALQFCPAPAYIYLALAVQCKENDISKTMLMVVILIHSHPWGI